MDNPDYGYRMIHRQLIEDGYAIGNNRVLKYMGMLGIQALYPHKKKITSLKNSEHPVYPYLLKPYWYKTGHKTKAVKVDTPNGVWSGDITYIRMNGGFMYLAAVIDWNSRAILAHINSQTQWMHPSYRCSKNGISQVSCTQDIQLRSRESIHQS